MRKFKILILIVSLLFLINCDSQSNNIYWDCKVTEQVNGVCRKMIDAEIELWNLTFDCYEGLIISELGTNWTGFLLSDANIKDVFPDMIPRDLSCDRDIVPLPTIAFISNEVMQSVCGSPTRLAGGCYMAGINTLVLKNTDDIYAIPDIRSGCTKLSHESSHQILDYCIGNADGGHKTRMFSYLTPSDPPLDTCNEAVICDLYGYTNIP